MWRTCVFRGRTVLLQFVWSIDCLIRLWSIGRSLDWFIDSVIYWFNDWLIDWSIAWLIDWLIDWSIDWLIDFQASVRRDTSRWTDAASVSTSASVRSSPAHRAPAFLLRVPTSACVRRITRKRAGNAWRSISAPTTTTTTSAPREHAFRSTAVIAVRHYSLTHCTLFWNKKSNFCTEHWLFWRVFRNQATAPADSTLPMGNAATLMNVLTTPAHRARARIWSAPISALVLQVLLRKFQSTMNAFYNEEIFHGIFPSHWSTQSISHYYSVLCTPYCE